MIANQPAFNHVDFLLRIFVDDVGNQACELDRIFLILKQFEFQRFIQPLVRFVIKLLAVDGKRTDVIHDLAAEIVLPAIGNIDFLFNRAHQPLIRLFVLAGEGVLHLLLLRVGLDVVDVVAAKSLEGVFIGGNGALHFQFDDVLVLFLHHAQQIAVFLLHLLVVDETVMLQAAFQFIEHHERINRTCFGMGHQRVGNLVLHIARRDSHQTFVVSLIAKFSDILLGEARQTLTVVQLEFLQPRQTRMLRFFQPCENRPHRRHFNRVRGDMPILHRLGVVIFLVDELLVFECCHVRNVDLHRSVAQRFHEFVVFQPAIFRFVRVADNHFIDIGLREFLRLDTMLLAGPEQVVQERHVEFQHFDELDDPSIRDVEFAVEVERSRVAIAAIDGDLAVIDVACEFRGILVLFVLGLERTDADAILFAQDHTLHADVLNHAGPIAIVLFKPLLIHEPAERIELAANTNPKVSLAFALIEACRHALAKALGNQVQRLLVHRAPMHFLGILVVDPTQGVQRAIVRFAIALQTLFQQPHDRALAAPHGTMQKQYTLFNAIFVGRAFERIH